MIIEKEGKQISIAELEKISGAKWSSSLYFEGSCREKISKKIVTMKKKQELAVEHIWLGALFQKEILSSQIPDVVIRWMDPMIGWGVFANRDLKKMEFIGEYYGRVRPRRRRDQTNAYICEYLICPGMKTRFVVDAAEEGGVARYINHSEDPNLAFTLVNCDEIHHVILYTKRGIARGEQLCYDYGPDYWKKRKAPQNLL